MEATTARRCRYDVKLIHVCGTRTYKTTRLKIQMFSKATPISMAIIIIEETTVNHFT